MIPFAFCGRVSTEDLQDHESSYNWQRQVGEQLIAPVGGFIVETYFDAGQSRSVPWTRRPEASRLLADIARPDRAFDAVVIAEPQRAFYDRQFGDVFPRLVAYGVDLWVPELGGRIDPDNDVHDLMMAIFGGLGKAERKVVKRRVRASMAAQASIQGRYLGGRPPYGYLIVELGPHPNPRKASEGHRLKGLVLDPVAAPVVALIFTWRIEELAYREIAKRLNRAGVPCPSAHDPDRNRHRAGDGWQVATVRSILTNPRYTGFVHWGRYQRVEELIDRDQPSDGHVTRMRPATPELMVRSDQPAHDAIVTEDVFAAVQATLTQRDGERSPRTTSRPYLLRGLLSCGICGRKMQGNFNNNRIHYRCRERDLVPGLGQPHPKTVYLREDQLVHLVDAWIAGIFDEDHASSTMDAIVAEVNTGASDAPQRSALATRLRQAQRKVDQHRRGLEAGGDPAMFTAWINEALAEVAAADLALSRLARPRTITADDVVGRLGALGVRARTVSTLDIGGKVDLYNELNLQMTYHPSDTEPVVMAEITPCALASVGGGT